MAMEIERRYLVSNTKEFREDLVIGCKDEYKIRQVYMPVENMTSRIRMVEHEQEQSAYWTVKTKSDGFSKHEFEFDIDYDEATEMLKILSLPSVIKTRYIYPVVCGNITYKWEVDIFDELNEGLVIAEIELVSENRRFAIPPWNLIEITGIGELSNYHLSKHPFKTWRETDLEELLCEKKKLSNF